MPSQGTNNNGNVGGYYFADSVDAPSSSLSHTVSYIYDSVNRLAYDPVNNLAGATAKDFSGNTLWSQIYSYTGDGSNGQYGNMSCTWGVVGPGGGCVNFAYNAANNRISGYTYDGAGNVLNDTANTYYWDGESHLISVVNGQGVAISTNTYNALGQRVRDVANNQGTWSTTDEAYGAGGSLLWRYTGDPEHPGLHSL